MWPIEKVHHVALGSLLDHGQIEWQRRLKDFESAWDVAYQDVLNEFDLMWLVKGLVVTHSNLVVTWKITLKSSY